MKSRIFTILLLIGTGLAANAQNEPAKISLTPTGTPKMHLAVTEHDFGDIVQGQQPSYVFTFVNEGSAPLVISTVDTPCSCTAPTYSKEPIEPGKTGEIKIQFNSTGKSGNFVKTVTVKFNSDQSPEFITIKGNVVLP